MSHPQPFHEDETTIEFQRGYMEPDERERLAMEIERELIGQNKAISISNILYELNRIGRLWPEKRKGLEW